MNGRWLWQSIEGILEKLDYNGGLSTDKRSRTDSSSKSEAWKGLPITIYDFHSIHFVDPFYTQMLPGLLEPIPALIGRETGNGPPNHHSAQTHTHTSFALTSSGNLEPQACLIMHVFFCFRKPQHLEETRTTKANTERTWKHCTERASVRGDVAMITMILVNEPGWIEWTNLVQPRIYFRHNASLLQKKKQVYTLQILL